METKNRAQRRYEARYIKRLERKLNKMTPEQLEKFKKNNPNVQVVEQNKE